MNFSKIWEAVGGFFSGIWEAAVNVDWWTVIASAADIVIVACVVYWLMMLAKRTRAWQIIWGLVIFFLITYLTEALELHTINYLLRILIPLGPVAIVILFFPELRSALENMGRMANIGNKFPLMAKEEVTNIIDAVAKAAASMSRKKTGALIVMERETVLDDIAATGTKLDCLVSDDILGTIFYNDTPLHDGAVIIRGKRIYAAGCTLPLTVNTEFGTVIHTRHKAAIGMAEVSDAVVIVVSEETGTVSIAHEGKLYRDYDERDLTARLRELLVRDEDPGNLRSRFTGMFGGKR